MIEKYLNQAFRIIRRNYGCPGSDGISIKTIKKNYFIHKSYLNKLLSCDEYTFGVPKEVIIQDYLEKRRNIFVYNVYDRWVQESIKLSIMPVMQEVIPAYVYGNIKKRTSMSAAEFIIDNSPNLVLKLDVSAFFQNINRDILIHQISILDIPTETIDLIRASFSHTPFGLPPGNCLSPLLSDLYLQPIDYYFNKSYIRYADDMTFLLSTEHDQVSIIADVKNILSELGLSLNDSKTRLIYSPNIEDLL